MSPAVRAHDRPFAGVRSVAGLAISVALHVLVFALVFAHRGGLTVKPDQPAGGHEVTVLALRPPASAEPKLQPAPAALVANVPTVPRASITLPEVGPTVQPDPPRQAATMAAPTAEEWAFAGRYTLKNSKGYRYTWGQQVRSLMGTAVEGPDQGVVRFRVEIARDGTLAKLQTLWSTSPVAERLARQAIDSMPQGPPTPTGKPLIFEKTISFTPYASDSPPIHKDDCLPDPPAFNNPFAWDGHSARMQIQTRTPDRPDPRTLEDCLKQLPQDSIEAESARDRRLMEQWGSGRLGR